jgi:hypothetical protein
MRVFGRSVPTSSAQKLQIAARLLQAGEVSAWQKQIVI